MSDARAFLSAALTNKNTCLEGLDSASGPLKPVLVNSLIEAYKHVSNSLSILAKSGSSRGSNHRRRLLRAAPAWVLPHHARFLQSLDEYDPSQVLTVAADGTANFTTITDAINFAPNNSYDRIVIYVKEGIYDENVDIPSYKPNIVLMGDGRDVTVITGNRSVADGWTTFRSATVCESPPSSDLQNVLFLFSGKRNFRELRLVRIHQNTGVLTGVLISDGPGRHPLLFFVFALLISIIWCSDLVQLFPRRGFWRETLALRTEQEQRNTKRWPFE